MEFYSYNYLKAKLAVIDYVQWAVGAVVIVVLAVALFRYFHNKKDTKYRELALIAFIGILILIGTKVNELQTTQINENKNTATVHLIELISDKLHVDKNSIYINAQAAKDGAIVKIEDQFYRVIISGQSDQFLLEKMTVEQPDIKIVEVE